MSDRTKVKPKELSSPKPQPGEVSTSGIVTAKKRRHRISGINVFLTILIVAACVLTIPCCIRKYEKNCSEDIMQQTLEAEKNRGARLRIEYEIRTDYKVIEDYVTNNLMMKKQENYQVEYVLRDNANMSVVVNPEGYDDNLLTVLSRTLSAITEYFR